jgi:polar amino acid transport system permease protein
MLFEIFGYILLGTFVTLGVTAVSMPFGFVVGLLFAALRVYGGRYLERSITVYSVIMRGIPPVVLLFILYFILAQNINLSPFWAGSISLGLISSSYQMEIFRGAFQSIASGQMIAARSIGMNQVQSIRYIILPQALRNAIPPWSNEAANLVKDSSLVFVIGVPEILRRAQFVSARTFQPFMAYSIAAVIYFLLTFTVNRILDYVENKSSIPSNITA